MSNHRVMLLVVALAWSAGASACLNESGVNRHGQSVELVNGIDTWRLLLTTPPTSPDELAWARVTIERVRKKPDIDNLTDLSVVLVELGRPADAVVLLQRIERIAPGRYATATNLGTAYELLGKNADALAWIAEGIKRNPDSHAGSEWLHVRILGAKLKSNQPLSLGVWPVTGMDFGNSIVPTRPARVPTDNMGKPQALSAVGRAIGLQLRERAPLVSPRDPIVAGLFLDWANVESVDGSLEIAQLAYEMAVLYGAVETPLIAARRKEVARLLSKYND
jgi:tetratricopeptide (TPR) repeat protein